MVLGAGFGRRLRPLTLARPKPLAPFLGTTLIGWTIARLRRAGVGRIVVNTHYKAAMLEDRLRRDPRIHCLREPRILGTGGGVRNALPLLGAEPFLVCNADAFWRDAPDGPGMLARLAAAWDGRRMDALLLLYPVSALPEVEGVRRPAGDYFMEAGGSGRPRRRRGGGRAPLLFAGVHILHPGLLRHLAVRPGIEFSLTRAWDAAEARGRLHAVIHDGDWFHLGDAASLTAAAAACRNLRITAKPCGKGGS